MIGSMKRGEDIEFYADKYEERQEVLREMNEEESGGGFPEEDERESRKTVAMQRKPY